MSLFAFDSIAVTRYGIDLSDWNENIISQADVCTSSNDKEKAMVLMINLARIDGHKFSKTLLQKYKGVSTPSELVSLVSDLTNNGNKTPLKYNLELQNVAKHRSSSNLGDRIKKYAPNTEYSNWGESAYTTSNSNIGESVINILLDKYDKSRTTRKRLLSSEFNTIGVSCESDSRQMTFIIELANIRTKVTVSNNNETNEHVSSTNNQNTTPLNLSAFYTESELKAANTAVSESYMNQIEKDVIFLCNLSRLDGLRFKKMVYDYYEKAYKGSPYLSSLWTTLSSIKNLPMLKPNNKLYTVAKSHVNDIGSKGLMGHNSSDGTSFSDRMNKFVGRQYGVSENISYGSTSAMDIVMHLLIDDKVPSVGHRKNILRYESVNVGVSYGYHKTYSVMCVMDFCTK